MYHFQALVGTTILHFVFAFITLDKKQMAGIVFAISMSISSRTTLVTNRNNIPRNSLAPTLIKNKILSYKFIIESLFFAIVCVLDDS
jgi:hypothetical protein